MNQKIFAFFCFFISQATFAQKIIGKVISEKNKTAIPFASISYKNHSKGLCADSTGKFEIEDAFMPDDSLVISCIGYLQGAFSISDAVKIHDFILQERIIRLSEVSVKKRETIIELKGSRNNETKEILMSRILDNYEIALLMPNDEKAEGIIKNVGFFITKHGKPKTPFRVRIYAINEQPAQDLLNESVVITAKRGGKWVVVDVSKYAISIPENGFVVSMEHLFNNNKKYLHEFTVINKKAQTKETKVSFGQQIGLTHEFSQSFGWSRSNGGRWNKFFFSPMIRSEVEVYK